MNFQRKDNDMKVCSFTGHRVIEYAHRPHMAELLDRAIEYVYGEGCRIFCTGGAIGFDTVAAQRVILFRMSHPDVRLEVIIPCANQADRWQMSDVSAYEYILGNADHVECLSDNYYPGCMAARNRRLVKRCDFLIAYMTHSDSGAGQTVSLAKASGKQVFNLAARLDKLSD